MRDEFTLHGGVATACAAEWRVALPAAVDALAAELQGGRAAA